MDDVHFRILPPAQHHRPSTPFRPRGYDDLEVCLRGSVIAFRSGLDSLKSSLDNLLLTKGDFPMPPRLPSTLNPLAKDTAEELGLLVAIRHRHAPGAKWS